MRAQEELEEPQEAKFATAFPKEHEYGLRNRPPPPRPGIVGAGFKGDPYLSPLIMCPIAPRPHSHHRH